MNDTERRIYDKYAYNKTYIFLVYEELERRVNSTLNEYKELKRGECRFDYISWENRLNITRKKLQTAIKYLSDDKAIKQVVQGKKGGGGSIYFLTRFEDNQKDNLKDKQKDKNKRIDINGLDNIEDKQRNNDKDKQKDNTSKYNNLNIKSKHNNLTTTIENIKIKDSESNIEKGSSNGCDLEINLDIKDNTKNLIKNLKLKQEQIDLLEKYIANSNYDNLDGFSYYIAKQIRDNVITKKDLEISKKKSNFIKNKNNLSSWAESTKEVYEQYVKEEQELYFDDFDEYMKI